MSITFYKTTLKIVSGIFSPLFLPKSFSEYIGVMETFEFLWRLVSVIVFILSSRATFQIQKLTQAVALSWTS